MDRWVFVSYYLPTYLPDLNTLVGKYVGTIFFPFVSFPFLTSILHSRLEDYLTYLLIETFGIQVCQLNCCKMRILPSRGK